MKKIFVLLIMSVLFTSMMAQSPNIPDGGFEAGWTQYSFDGSSYWDYQNSIFYTLNELYEEPLINVLTTYRETTDPQQGSYAMKLVSKAPPTFIPGAFGTISPNFIEEFLNNGGLDVRKSFAFTEQPVALMGYYKYIPVAGDSAVIDFAVYRGNNELASAKIVEKNMLSSWKSFYIPLDYQTEELPDKVKILFVASAGYDFDNLENCKGRENSTLYIDNIAFAYTSGWVEPLLNTMKVECYPNPATSTLNLIFEKQLNAQLYIYAINGALIQQITVNDAQYQLSLINYKTGTYFYRLCDEKMILSTGKFEVVK